MSAKSCGITLLTIVSIIGVVILPMSIFAIKQHKKNLKNTKKATCYPKGGDIHATYKNIGSYAKVVNVRAVADGHALNITLEYPYMKSFNNVKARRH